MQTRSKCFSNLAREASGHSNQTTESRASSILTGSISLGTTPPTTPDVSPVPEDQQLEAQVPEADEAQNVAPEAAKANLSPISAPKDSHYWPDVVCNLASDDPKRVSCARAREIVDRIDVWAKFDAQNRKSRKKNRGSRNHPALQPIDSDFFDTKTNIRKCTLRHNEEEMTKRKETLLETHDTAITGFRSWYELKRHMRSHLCGNHKPYRCPLPTAECGMSFAQRVHAVNHIRTHTGEKLPCRYTIRDEYGQEVPCPHQATDPAALSRHNDAAAAIHVRHTGCTGRGKGKAGNTHAPDTAKNIERPAPSQSSISSPSVERAHPSPEVRELGSTTPERNPSMDTASSYEFTFTAPHQPGISLPFTDESQAPEVPEGLASRERKRTRTSYTTMRPVHGETDSTHREESYQPVAGPSRVPDYPVMSRHLSPPFRSLSPEPPATMCAFNRPATRSSQLADPSCIVPVRSATPPASPRPSSFNYPFYFVYPGTESFYDSQSSTAHMDSHGVNACDNDDYVPQALASSACTGRASPDAHCQYNYSDPQRLASNPHMRGWVWGVVKPHHRWGNGAEDAEGAHSSGQRYCRQE